jgi:hypothetical protein
MSGKPENVYMKAAPSFCNDKKKKDSYPYPCLPIPILLSLFRYLHPSVPVILIPFIVKLCARHLLVITNSQRAFRAQSVAPESFNGSGISAMCEQQPETKDRLGKNVQDGIGDDLGVNAPLPGAIANTPDDWVQSPENEGEATNGSKKLGGGAALAHGCTTARDDKLVNDDEISNASNGIPSPLLTIVLAKSSKETSKDHDDICNDGNKDASTVHTSQESQVEEEKWCSQAPVDVSGPEYLTEDVFNGIRNVLVYLLDNDMCV